jgi:hypothetical protein
MKNITFIKALILAITFLFFPYTTTVMADSVVEKLLPHNPGITGWQLAGDSYHYLPENLYNYINGAADLFISYGFVKLVGAEYTPGSGKKDYLIADIYDMGNKLNAFGVFQSKRNPESNLLKIGTGAYGDEKYIFFYKNRFYAEIQGNQSTQQSKDILMALAKKVVSGISGDSTPPSELNYLPDTGRIPGSEIYITGGILGHAFLDRGLVSDYKIDGEEIKAFIAFYPSKKPAVTAFNHYKEFLKKSGEKWTSLKSGAENGFVSQEPYHKNIIVAQQGHFVAGVYDLSHAQKGEALLKSILEKIK